MSTRIESNQLQKPVRPMRLWVSPKTASRFEFTSITVGIQEQLIEIPTPCQAFAQYADGMLFEMRLCETANKITMNVRNLNQYRGAEGKHVDFFEAVLWCDIFEYA